MIAGSEPAPPNRFRDLLDALFGEARRRQRRRRRRCALLALLASAAAVLLVAFLERPSGGSVTVTAARVRVVSRALPGLGSFSGLSVVRGRLTVSDTSAMSYSGGRVEGTCSVAAISPESLRVASVVRGNCGDPALYGRHVLPIVYRVSLRPGPRWGTDELGIRIATVDRAAVGGYRLGPLVVGYPDCSDCRAQMIYGPDALWVYAPFTAPGAPGELLRISTVTGRVTERWRLPEVMPRVLLATDADGLWIAPGFDSCCFPGPRFRYDFVYHASPGAAGLRPVLDVGSGGADWLVAAGHTVWTQPRIIRPCTSGDCDEGPAPVWRLEGGGSRARQIAARLPQQCFDAGEGSPTVLGDLSIGIFCVAAQAERQQVIRLDPSGHSAATLATVPTVGPYSTVDSAAVLDGAYYFLEPPSTVRAGAPPVIFRVRAS